MSAEECMFCTGEPPWRGVGVRGMETLVPEGERCGMKQSKMEHLEDRMERPILNRRVGIVKLQMVREGTLYGERRRLTDPEQAAELVRPMFVKADREVVLVMSLSAALEPLAVEIVSVGGTDSIAFARMESCLGSLRKHRNISESRK